jgi:hypothetical protein
VLEDVQARHFAAVEPAAKLAVYVIPRAPYVLAQKALERPKHVSEFLGKVFPAAINYL